MFATYEDALKFLYDSLPMFQRIGAAALKNDLSNTLKLCEALGNPQRSFKSIHVAGTNGKGSTAHMLAAVLQASGYKTGLYTSPHLKDFTERIRIDGHEVAKDFILDFVNRVYPLIQEIEPSFFEITVAMAFDYFAKESVDIAIIEVGMGGRLDSTNIIRPVLSIITNIGWDHKDLLGETLEKIASEKAGIIKAGIPVVISERQPEVQSVFTSRSESLEAPLHFASDEYTAGLAPRAEGSCLNVARHGAVVYEKLELELGGMYQRKNVIGAICAINLLRESGWDIDEVAMREGLRQVASITGLKGRWQILGRHPFIVCDTAHNAEGIREVMAQVMAQTFRDLHIVFGAVKDKDISSVLALLPKDASYYFCQARLPRALDARELSQKALAMGLHGEAVPDVNEAIATAMMKASSDDMIFIGGSTFVVAEIQNL